MVPRHAGKNVHRDILRRLRAMSQRVVHDIPVKSIKVPMLINKGPNQGPAYSNPVA